MNEERNNQVFSQVEELSRRRKSMANSGRFRWFAANSELLEGETAQGEIHKDQQQKDKVDGRHGRVLGGRCVREKSEEKSCTFIWKQNKKKKDRHSRAEVWTS